MASWSVHWGIKLHFRCQKPIKRFDIVDSWCNIPLTKFHIGRLRAFSCKRTRENFCVYLSLSFIFIIIILSIYIIVNHHYHNNDNHHHYCHYCHHFYYASRLRIWMHKHLVNLYTTMKESKEELHVCVYPMADVYPNLDNRDSNGIA